MKGLYLRNGRWLARLTVPKDVRDIIGKHEFLKSLGIKSKAQAEIHAMQVIAGWKLQIEKARGTPSSSLQELTSLPLSKRVQILKESAEDLAHQTPNYSEQDLIDLLTAFSTEDHSDQNKRFVADAYGVACDTRSHLDEYVQVKLSGIENRSRDEHIGVLNKTILDAFPFLDDENYSRDKVIGWWERQTASGLSSSTLRKYLSHTKAFSKWLVYKGYLTKPNYFADLEPITKRQANRDKKGKLRRPFSDADCNLLLNNADQQLKPLILMGMYTGCRIEELCNLTVDDIYVCPVNSRRYIDIPISKTKKGENRQVPLHREIEHLIPDSGYLVDAGKVNNKYGERSSAIGKKFGRLKTKLGYGGDKVFHSLRKSFIDKLAQLNTPEKFAADIVGHEIGTMTYGVYASDTPVEQLFQWVDAVEYN